MMRPPRAVVRRDAGLWACEGALRRRGFDLVAGADEAGRGACAGPLVVGACILPDGKRGQVPGLNDSKLLAPAVREEVYGEVVRRAVAWSVVIIPAAEPVFPEGLADLLEALAADRSWVDAVAVDRVVEAA